MTCSSSAMQTSPYLGHRGVRALTSTRSCPSLHSSSMHVMRDNPSSFSCAQGQPTHSDAVFCSGLSCGSASCERPQGSGGCGSVPCRSFPCGSALQHCGRSFCTCYEVDCYCPSCGLPLSLFHGGAWSGIRGGAGIGGAPRTREFNVAAHCGGVPLVAGSAMLGYPTPHSCSRNGAASEATARVGSRGPAGSVPAFASPTIFQAAPPSVPSGMVAPSPLSAAVVSPSGNPVFKTVSLMPPFIANASVPKLGLMRLQHNI